MTLAISLRASWSVRTSSVRIFETLVSVDTVIKKSLAVAGVALPEVLRCVCFLAFLNVVFMSRGRALSTGQDYPPEHA